jgi:hypothetical protein
MGARPHTLRKLDHIITILGKPQAQGPPAARQVGDAVTVTIPLHWSAATLNFIVSWNAAGKIQGTWFHAPEPNAARPDLTAQKSIAAEPSVPPPDCWNSLNGSTEAQVKDCLGRPAWTNKHGREWVYRVPWASSDPGVAVQFSHGKVNNRFFIPPEVQKEHKDRAETWRAIGQVALFEYTAYQCHRVRSKPILLMSGNDLAWLQYCSEQGL